MTKNNMKAHAGSVMQVDVVALRGSLVEAIMLGEGTYRDYARGLNTYFAATFGGSNLAWYEVDRADKSDMAKASRAEMTALSEALKAAEYSNPAVVTGRVKKYAAEEHAALLRAQTVEAGGEADGGNGAGSKARSPELRFTEELIKLYKFGLKQDDLSQKCEAAMEDIAVALKSMGVDAQAIKV
jgi:hypothetical protein